MREVEAVRRLLSERRDSNPSTIIDYSLGTSVVATGPGRAVDETLFLLLYVIIEAGKTHPPV